MTTIQVRLRDHHQPRRYNLSEVKVTKGDWCVVEVDEETQECGQCVSPAETVPPEWETIGMPRVLRPAVEAEVQKAHERRQEETHARQVAREFVAKRELEMDVVEVEYPFKGNRIRFFFTAEGRVDFRDLVKDLAQVFHARIDMRQIGVRDKSGRTGGFGHCGQQLCCCRFLTEFKPVTIKMAKDQQLALNPTKISGQCGRLMCCLRYEHSQYLEGFRPAAPPPPLDQVAD